MLDEQRIQDLLKLPLEERRMLLRMLKESLSESQLEENGERSTAANWLLSMAGRYSGGPGNTAAHADEILRDEIEEHSGLTSK